MSKTPEMNRVLDEISQVMFGAKRSESIDTQVCVICGADATEFRNAISRKEFGISGMCQKCQDSVFGVDAE